MNGRICLALLLAGLTVLSGCASSGGPGTGEVEYYVAANGVESPPANATVIDANDRRIRNVTPLQTVIAKATAEGNAQITVNESTYETVTNALDGTPLYRNDSGFATSEGLYVRSEGTVVRVSAYSRELV